MLTGLITDYEGRSVDVGMFDGYVTGRDAQLTQQLVSESSSGLLLTGPLKLVQRFFLELMTERGSLMFLPQRGSTFMLDAQRGYWRTPGDVSSSFYAALLDIKNNLIQDENPDDPSDECFRGAELLGVSVTPNLVTARIKVTTAAGDAPVITFPLRTSYV